MSRRIDPSVDLTLDQLDELEAKATPGPWVDNLGKYIVHVTTAAIGNIYTMDGGIVVAGGTDQTDADMTFIAAARNALPKLVARIRSLEGPKPRPTIDTQIKRRDDMGKGHLVLFASDDGDVTVEVRTRYPMSSCSPGYSVEFCTPGSGGGGSTHTWEALRALAAAMELDNKEKPQR